MAPSPPERVRILFLYSDTGGGHRSAAEAIREALDLEYGDRHTVDMVDVFKQYAPIPLNRLPDFYPRMVKFPRVWSFGYHLSDGERRARLVTASFWPYVRRRVQTLLTSHPSDMIVSCHPLANRAMLAGLGRPRPPFITMVTDLVSTHAMWYDRRVDLCLVPTEPARQRALQCGLEPERVRVVGLPVAERFCQPPGDPYQARRSLGWPEDRPAILLVGGGEGMGPVEPVAQAISRAELPATLIVISGRNQALQRRLEAAHWSIPTRVYGFVDQMPEFMHAADILVTKAGPGTISEAFNAGLPLVLYNYLPGQEDGNLSYVVSNGAGVWAPQPDQVVATLRRWLQSEADRQMAAAASIRLARPRAARNAARLIHQQLEKV